MDSAIVLANTNAGSGCTPCASVSDRPAIRHVADQLPDRIDELVVTCAPDQRASIAGALDGVDYRSAVDPFPADGLLSTLRTGFRIATGSTVTVVTVDRVGPDADLLGALYDAVDTAAVPRADGVLYPLHAVYDRFAASQAVDRTLATGSNSLYDLLTQIDPTVVDANADAESEGGLAPTDARGAHVTVSGNPGE